MTIMAHDQGETQGAEYKVGPGRPPLEHRFQPGHSGNPGGKGRWKPLTDALVKHLAANPGDAEIIAKRLVEDWKSGSSKRRQRSLSEGWARIEGKVPDELHASVEQRCKILLLGGSAPAGLEEAPPTLQSPPPHTMLEGEKQEPKACAASENPVPYLGAIDISDDDLVEGA